MYIYIYVYVCMYVYIYIYVCIYWVALPVQRYLSNAASFVLCAAYSVKDQHNLIDNGPTIIWETENYHVMRWFWAVFRSGDCFLIYVHSKTIT